MAVPADTVPAEAVLSAEVLRCTFYGRNLRLYCDGYALDGGAGNLHDSRDEDSGGEIRVRMRETAGNSRTGDYQDLVIILEKKTLQTQDLW